MPYTLSDYERLATDDLKRGVVDVFRRESFAMDLMTFEDTDNLSVQVLRTKSLPSVAFRKIGETWSESKGEFEPVQENIFQLGGYIDVDKVLERAAAVVNQRAQQSDMFVTSIAYTFNDYFINGDPTVDEDGFTGLWYRIRNYHSSQEVAGGGLDVSPDAASLSSNQVTLLDYYQGLIHKCEGHKCDALFCNSTLYLRTLSALRASGLLATTRDNYNRWVTTYGEGGPMIYDIGTKGDQSSLIIGNTETNDGSALTGGAATSCYAVKFGENFLMGVQLYPIDVVDKGLLENGVTLRTIVDWPVGLYLVNPRSIARLKGVIAA